MKILICDDDPIFIEELTQLIDYSQYDEVMHIEIKSLTQTKQMKAEVKLNKYDIAYLDIEMNDINGLDLAKEIIKKNPLCTIVFITYHENYISDALELPIKQYLLKPLNHDLLNKTLSYGIHKYKMYHNRITLHTKEGKVELLINDIYYIETYYKNIQIYTKHQVYHCHINHLNVILSKVQQFHFYKIHQSYYLNFIHIADIQSYQIILDNEIVLPLSPKLKNEVLQIYYQYVLRDKIYEYPTSPL